MKATNENIRLLKPFLRGLPLIVLTITVALMAARRYLRYATPQYESTAKIRLADTKDGSPSANLFKDFDVFATANKIGGEVEVIKSRIIIQKALDSLDFDVSLFRVGKIRKVELYHESPFLVRYQFDQERWFDKPFTLQLQANGKFALQVPGETAPRSGQLGTAVALDGGTLLIERNDSLLRQRPTIPLADHFEFIVHSRQRLADLVLGQLDISSVDKEIPILRLNFKSAVPEKAAAFVNRLAQTYVDDYIETKFKAANTTVNFLDNQLQEVGGKLSASENAIESYRNAKNIVNIRQETETDLRKIADMKVQQTNVKMNLEAIQNLERYMVKGRDNVLELAPNFEAYTDLLATELVKKMKQLQAEKKDLLTKYTPEYEEVKNIDEKLRDISTYLEEGIRNTRKSLETKYARISDDIETAEEAFVGLPNKEKTMGILNRNFALNEETYNFLHGKRTEAQIARAATISFHRIISPGETPRTPVSPNGTLIKVLAVFLGFLGSVLLIYMVHVLKGKVNDIHTIEKNSSIPLAGTTPMLRKPMARRNWFHKLAIQLEIKELLQPGSLLALTSFSKSEGKRFNAFHLAQELATQEKNVLLADLDGECRLSAEYGGSRLFAYADLSQQPGLFTNSDTLRQALDGWKKQYDLILLKNETLEQASNGLLLMKLADANLFILDSRKTPAKMVAEAELLQEEYQFARMHFLLNREGYNPNLLRQAWDLSRTVMNWILTRKK